MNDILNPYIAGAPVVETSMFFGREDVFNWIERSLAGKYVDHILVLHGQRRVGKTSVLKQIPNFLPDKYIQVFFDLQGRTGTTLDRFLWWVASEIVRTLKTEHDVSLPKPDRKTFEDPEYLVNEFLPSLRPSLGEKVLLLTFDEFDTLDRPEIQYKLAEPLIVYLRRLIELDDLNFIFSIGSSGDKLENMQASYTDFFKSALYRKISFLTPDDCHRLITKPVEGLIKYEKKAVDQIVKISSGHPYFAQLICHELFSRCQKTGAREISAKDVEGVLDDVIERGTVNLKFVWDEASDLEKWILAALAQMDGGNNQKLAQVLEAQRVRFSDSDLNSAIIHLQDKDVITKDNHFVIHLMRMWLIANRPMDRVREELAEVNPIANRYVEIGDEYHDREQYQAAIESYQQALNVDAGNLKAQLSIATVYLEQKDYSKAVTAFELALKIDDEDVVSRTGYCDANLALGTAAQSGGETDAAIRFYQAILVVNPAHTDARQRTASIYKEQAEGFLVAGRDDEALEAFKQAMMSTPEDDRLSSRYEEVLAEKKSKVINSWLGKAEKALSKERWDEAAEMVVEAIKVDPEDQDLQAKLREVKDAPRQFKLSGYRREAEQAVARGNWDKAIAAIETAIQLAPEDQSLADWLAAIHDDRLSAQLDMYSQQVETAVTSEDWDAAIQAVQNAINLAPEDENWQSKLDEIKVTRHQAQLDSLRVQAIEARNANRWDDAIRLLEELLKLDDSEDVRAEIESARKEKREYKLATFRSQAEKATELENWSEVVQAWAAYLALTPVDGDSIESKLSYARKYAKISDDYDEAQIAIRKKRYGKAIELLQGIIAQDPTYQSTSRLLVEAVEANKAIPVWRRPWLPWAIGALAVVILGVFFGPRLLETVSTLPNATSIVEGVVNGTPEPQRPTSTIIPFVGEESQSVSFLDHITGAVPTFEDDFSTQKSEWGSLDQATITAGTLQISVENDRDVRIGGDHLSAPDFVIQFDFMVEGDDSTSVGFDIRNETFIFEIISGNWLISHVELNAASEASNYRLGEWNQLTIFAQGDQFAFYLNTNLLTAITESISGETNAFHADTDLEAQGTVFIDNLKFWDLDQIELEAEDTPMLEYTPAATPTPTQLNTPTPTTDLRILNPENQHFYRWFGDPTAPSGTSWKGARNYCEALGGYLVTIQDAAEDEFVYELSWRLNWLGATDETEEGTWAWITGEPWDYTNWGPDEPSNDNGEHYLSHGWGLQWEVKDLSTYFDFVCEWDPEPATPEPTPTPTADPRTLNPDNQHLYLYSGDTSRVGPKLWNNAADYCDSQGGYLATIQDATENDFIFQLTPGASGLIWLGAMYDVSSDTWFWITGEPFMYENWDVGKPNNIFRKYYLSYGSGKFWHDTSNEERNFICEWDP